MFLWRAKFNLLRLAVAAFLLFAVAADTGARLARVQLSALPTFDFAQEVEALRIQGRYGEALNLADAGLEGDDLTAETRERLTTQRTQIIQQRDSLLTKAKAAGLGALSGEGDSLESLVGAVTADFFIVGDIRDLVIQGGKQVIDGDSDGVILTLSVLGVITTLAPEIDWVPSLLKAAAKGGHLARPFATYLTSAIKAKRVDELKRVFTDIRSIADNASPGGAMRLLRHADGPDDIARTARFLDNTGRQGAAALHIANRQAPDLLKAADSAATQQALMKAARKGPAGLSFLRSPSAKALLRPHPLLGLAKALYKGKGEKLLLRALERLDLSAWWVIPLLAGWCVVEIGLLVGKATGGRAAAARTSKPPTARAA
ncbi:MAG TPA: hypothetical protein VD997_14835 [Phycisphaerales bacterium]|nr:hypothetical protein [Phycisphaerales bacterium]